MYIFISMEVSLTTETLLLNRVHLRKPFSTHTPSPNGVCDPQLQRAALSHIKMFYCLSPASAKQLLMPFRPVTQGD